MDLNRLFKSFSHYLVMSAIRDTRTLLFSIQGYSIVSLSSFLVSMCVNTVASCFKHEIFINICSRLADTFSM